MQNARRVILYLASFIGAWLLVSFGGAMFDSANAAFWSDSLMWSLLSFMVVSPALVFLTTPSPDRAPSDSTKSFVDHESNSQQTLWPEAKDADEWRDEWTDETSNHSVRAHT